MFLFAPWKSCNSGRLNANAPLITFTDVVYTHATRHNTDETFFWVLSIDLKTFKSGFSTKDETFHIKSNNLLSRRLVAWTSRLLQVSLELVSSTKLCI